MPYSQRAEMGGWQITKEDVAGLEASLSEIPKLKASNRDSSVHIDHPEWYFRQYYGISEDGKKRINVNAFCVDTPPFADWRKQLFITKGGGTCFWQAIYDPTAKKFLSFRINWTK